jgi:putative tryptophan/tyrosine transport system substrate-binding protein
MRRREFLGALGGAAAWPVVVRAQQPAMPVISYFNSGLPAAQVDNLSAFRQGLKDVGFVEGQSVSIEFRWAENQFDRLPALAADVVQRRPAVIVANTLSALRAKAATTAIPIVFTTGSDPVRDGLVTSLGRPGGNVTGVVFITGVLGGKRLELLRQFVPKATTIGMIVFPNTSETEAERTDLQAAAAAIGRQLIVLDIKSDGNIEAAFASLVARGVGALYVGTGPFSSTTGSESSRWRAAMRSPRCTRRAILRQPGAW